MAYNGFAIDEYLDANAITKQLDELTKKPMYSIKPDKFPPRRKSAKETWMDEN